MSDFLGVTAENGSGYGQMSGDIVEHYARIKRMPAGSFKAYGAAAVVNDKGAHVARPADVRT